MNKNRPDIIVTWPRNNDYPLWREFIRINRFRFGEIIIVFMNPNDGTDYRQFIKQSMEPDEITFLESPLLGPGEDWRNVAINYALGFSHSNWVYFTEQDFFVLDDEVFWNEIYVKTGHFDVVGVTQGARLHPCCIFIRRETLDKTHKDFGILPGVADHFYRIQEDIENSKVDHLYLADEKVFGYKHFNGLSQNWTLLARGEKPNYQAEDFYKYLESCLRVNVPLNPEWKIIAEGALTAEVQEKELPN